MQVICLQNKGSLATDKMSAKNAANFTETKFARKTASFILTTDQKKRVTETQIRNDNNWKILEDSKHIQNVEKVLKADFLQCNHSKRLDGIIT